jgi:hypothetical protein
MRARISKKTGMVAVGDTIQVRYLPAEPGVHALGSAPRRDTFMLWLTGLWLLLAGLYQLFGTQSPHAVRWENTCRG